MSTAKTPNEQTAELALGRIFRIMSRPFEPGDIEEYERCKAVFLEAVEETGIAERVGRRSKH